MFSRHVTKKLLAHIHGELTGAEAERVAAHLRRCARCREEMETLQRGDHLLRLLPSATAPAALWDRIEAALDTPPAPRRSPLRPLLPLAAALVLALGGGIAWRLLDSENTTKPSWKVARLAGAPRVGAHPIGETGRLPVGEWLQTDGSSRARLDLADIGQAEIGPNSRLRLVPSRANEHRIELARGALRAKANAPPRLFLVETPSAVAVDLGCAYTLDVDDAGGGVLRVTSGWVALERGGRASLVPAGARCATRPGVGPGTPVFEDAPAALKEALNRLDFGNGGANALGTVLAEARVSDALTLWHLLPRVEGPSERRAVTERLSALVPPPPGVTIEGVLALDKAMLDLWWEEIELMW